MNDDEENQALLVWEVARNNDIVKILVGDPALLARVRKMPGPLVRCQDLISRADAEIAQLAILEILK